MINFITIVEIDKPAIDKINVSCLLILYRFVTYLNRQFDLLISNCGLMFTLQDLGHYGSVYGPTLVKLFLL